MPVLRVPGRPCRVSPGRLGTRLLRAGAVLRTTAPTFPASADLAGGTGTRSFVAVSTQAGDWVLVESVAENGGNVATVTPSAAGLTFAKYVEVGAGDVNHTLGQKWLAKDLAGGSRTVTETPSGGSAPTTTNYRARITVVHGSDGPGGVARLSAAQTVSIGHGDQHSAMFVTVGDWSAGAVGSPSWTPGGTTVASEQQAGVATYVFGRWDDTGTSLAFVSHGISSPAYTTPSIAVLEMLGTTVATAGPPVRPLGGPVRSVVPAAARGGRLTFRTGTFTATTPQTGPPVYPLDHPVRAQRLPQRGGSTDSRSGTFAGVGPAVEPLTGPAAARVRVLPPAGRVVSRGGAVASVGPPVRPLDGPVMQARPQLARGGRVASRGGAFTALAPTTGPPVYPTGHPVQARRLPARGDRTCHAAGLYAGVGPALQPLGGPRRALAQSLRGGRVIARTGIAAAVTPQAGPPVYTLGHAIAARRQPARGGAAARRAGPYFGTGPAVPQLHQPAGRGRQQPPPPARGRTVASRGPVQPVGPAVRPLQRPVRSRLPGPVRFGRVDTLLPAFATPPPPFSVGVLAAADRGSGATATVYAPTAAAAVYAPPGSATDTRTGGPT